MVALRRRLEFGEVELIVTEPERVPLSGRPGPVISKVGAPEKRMSTVLTGVIP